MHQSIRMMTRRLILFILLFCLQTVITVAETSSVAVLTADNYTNFLDENKVVLVEFMAPWCGHCRKMEKEYENAATTLRRINSEGRLAVIDGSLKENYGLVDSAKIDGFPSFLLYRDGAHVLNYEGLRTEPNFVRYVHDKTGPLVTSVQSLDSLIKYFDSFVDPKSLKDDVSSADESLRNTHYFFIGMISATSSSVEEEDQIKEAYMQMMAEESARNDNSNVHFLFTASRNILDYYLVTVEPSSSFCIASVMLDTAHHSNTHSAVLRNDITTNEELRKFIFATKSDVLLPFRAGNLHILRNEYTPKNQVLVFCDSSVEFGKECLTIIQNVSPSYRGKFIFVSVSLQELHLYHTFGVKANQLQIIILNITVESQVEKFVFNAKALKPSLSSSQKEEINKDNDASASAALTEHNLKQFLDMYLNNELTPFYRTEESDGLVAAEEKIEVPDPEVEVGDRSLLPVKVTSLSFREKVIDSTETVLLFITAPWCGYCKSLEPVISSLAKLLHQRNRKYTTLSAIPSLAGLPTSPHTAATKVAAGAKDDILVAQIDASANDLHSLENININGFPTIVFVRYINGSGKKEAVEYSGERSVKNILQFIHKNIIPLTADVSNGESRTEEEVREEQAAEQCSGEEEEGLEEEETEDDDEDEEEGEAVEVTEEE